MTRLQHRNNSCDCGTTTTKESRSFVTKNKTYETRSGVQRKQEAAFNGCQKKISVNTLNLRGRVYLKKMENSLVTLPIRNEKINGESRVKLVKSPSKMCNKKCNKNGVSNGNHPLLDTSLEKIISAKIKMDIIDINGGIIQKEDSTLSNGILAKEIVKKLNKTKDEGTVIQDGDDIKEKDNIFLLNGEIPELDLKKEDSVSTAKCDINGIDIETDAHENIDNNSTSGLDCKKSIRKRNKRTRFEIFIKETCENLGLGIINDKRARKAPSSFSPESERKYNQTDHSVPKMVPAVTKKGLPFKKKGRKPKPKGPIMHYLDLYLKNKSAMSADESSDSQVGSSNGHGDQNETELCKQDVDKNIPSPIYHKKSETMSNTINVQRLSLNSTDLLHKEEKLELLCPRPEINKMKRKKKSKKVIYKKKKAVTKIESKEYNSPISQVLGYRICNQIKEMLVLFENGTSNWISSDNNINLSDLSEYYKDDCQDLSIINRLSYQEFMTQSLTESDDTETSDLSSVNHSEESDCDEVFFQTLPSVSPRTVTKAPQLPVIGHQSCNEENSKMLSEVDLNYLCTYAMSSKHIKLYPCELSKDVLVKADGEFYNIFLKQSIIKKHLKKEECFNVKSCEKLIDILEDCAVNNQCKVVVLSGVEDFFASNSVFEKLLKKTAALEGRKYEQDVSVLRYLVQTLRNFNKPIVGVIKKTAMGLPASLLSLFDMVFHEETEVRRSPPPSKKLKKCRKLREPVETMSNDDSDGTAECEKHQSFVFPRLMGLTESNELNIMGERKRTLSPTDITADVPYFNGAPLSQQLRCSVRHMKNNSKIQMKSCSRSRSDTVDDDLDLCELTETNDELTETNSLENLTLLEKQIEFEKGKTESYMADLMAYVNSQEKLNGVD